MHLVSCCLTLFLVVVSAVTFGADLYINYAMIRKHKNKEIHITNKYMTQITPVADVFMIWNIIYGLMIIWYVYIFYLLLCRQMVSQIKKLPLFPGIFWLLFIFVNVLNAAWIYLFLHNNMLASGIVLIVLTLLLYLVTLMAYRICWLDVEASDGNKNKDKEKNDAEHNESDVVELLKCEIVLLRVLTLNVLPLYAMWCTLAACVQWTMILQYFTFHLSDNVASIITLSILSFILFMYWHADVYFKRKQFIYTWLTYFVLIVTFVGIIVRYHHIGGHNKPGLFFAFILLIVSSFMTIVKLLSVCLCTSKLNDESCD